MTQVADFNVEDFESRTAADKAVYARFYIHPVLDEVESLKEGRPIYRDKDYVEIVASGNSTNIVRRPVSELDRARFSAQYAKFRQGIEGDAQLIGTPLAEIPWLTRSQIEELMYFKIRTLEQLSSVSDEACSKLVGLLTLRQRAQAVMEKAEKSAPFFALQEENTVLRAELEALKLAVSEQGKLLSANNKRV